MLTYHKRRSWARCRRGNAGPCSERNVPQRNTRDSHLWLRIVTRRERDVALGVIGPAAGFRRSGVDSVPHKITENDTQPCTPAPTVHGCVSQTVILTNPGPM